MSASPRVTPQQAWDSLSEGNERFITGDPQHPNQNVDRRNELVNTQAPDVALFGCSDSRLAAEIIFDCGLGDLFIARNMGHVVAESITASMEYAVQYLGSSLIVILAHDSCGAVAAAIEQSGRSPSEVTGSVGNTLAPLLPAVQQYWLQERRETPYIDAELVDADEIGRIHLRTTVNQLLNASQTIRDAVDCGEVAIVGCQYRLVEGRAVPYISVGKVEIDVPETA